MPVSRISNAFNLLLALAFVPYALTFGFSTVDVAMHILAGLFYMVLGFKSGVGGGAAKLMGVAGLWFGFLDGAMFVAIACATLLTQSLLTSTRDAHGGIAFLPHAVIGAAAVVAYNTWPAVQSVIA